MPGLAFLEQPVIGTQVSNVLITSCIRLDKKFPPSVGSNTLDFQLIDTQSSLTTKIYLDRECLEEGLAIVNAPDTSRISDTAILYQLRQIRSKFTAPSAFSLCRASGPLTTSHTNQPYTMFTLADYDIGHSSGMKLFNSIAFSVLKHGSNAQLNKNFVQELAAVANGKIKRILQDVISMFGLDSQITILSNERLGKNLDSLADLLMLSLINANSFVAKEIIHTFDHFC